MRFILETITGRKGIKNFSSLEEYVDFMTKNGDKIKNIVESDLPYDDKPVSVATPSQSNGWEQVNKATFGDVIKKAEKGDCVLPHKASSVFKDEAKFEPSKFSEKEDTSSEPKVDSTPVKNNNEGSEKDLPKFEYKDESKSSSETSEKSEPKEEKKDSEEKDDKKKEQVDEGFGDKIHDFGVKAKQKLGIGLSGEELEEYINEYFVYVFMIANHQIEPNHPSFEKIANKLIKTDSKMKNVHEVVMSILEDKYYMKGFPADIIEDLLKRRLAKLGIDESIIDKAYETFVNEEKNVNESFDEEIEEALKAAGIQLDEIKEPKKLISGNGTTNPWTNGCDYDYNANKSDVLKSLKNIANRAKDLKMTGDSSDKDKRYSFEFDENDDKIWYEQVEPLLKEAEKGSRNLISIYKNLSKIFKENMRNSFVWHSMIHYLGFHEQWKPNWVDEKDWGKLADSCAAAAVLAKGSELYSKNGQRMGVYLSKKDLIKKMQNDPKVYIPEEKEDADDKKIYNSLRYMLKTYSDANKDTIFDVYSKLLGFKYDELDDILYYGEDGHFDEEIEEALRIAGVQLNESNAMEDAIDCVDSAMDDFGGSDDEYLRSVCKDCAEEYGVDVKKLYHAYTGHKWSALDKDEEYDDVDEDVNNPNDGDVDEKTGKEKLMEEDPSANFNQDEVDDLMAQYERAESDYHAADFYDDNYSWNKGRSSASSRMSDIENKLKQLTGKSYKELLDTLGSKQVDEDKGPSFKVGDKFNKNGRTYEIEKIEKSESKSRDHQYTNYWYHVREIDGSHVDVFTDSLMKELGFKPIAQ